MTPEELHELNLRCVRAMGKVLCAKDCPVCAANPGATHECDFYESHGGEVFFAGDGDTFSPATDPAQAHAMVDEWLEARDTRRVTAWTERGRKCVALHDRVNVYTGIGETRPEALSLAFCEAVERTRT